MKGLFTLFKLEYDGMFLATWVIVGVMAVLQLVMFGWRLARVTGNENLAEIIELSGVHIIFAIGFAGLLGLIGARLAMNYTPSKSMYALLTLPVHRGHIYLAKLAAALFACFVFVVSQMVLLVIFSAWHGALDITRRNADLYLTLLDTSFLRMIFPPHLFSLVFSLLGVGGSACVALYVAVRLRVGQKRYAVIVAALWLAVLLVTFPLINNPLLFNIIFMLCMIVIPWVASIRGVKLFESGEVAG